MTSRYLIKFVNPNPNKDPLWLGSVAFSIKAANRHAAKMDGKMLMVLKLKMPEFVCEDDGKRADS